MNRRSLPALIPAILLSMLLAYLLRDVIHRLVILPLAYLWWLGGIYYHVIPQVWLWILLVVGVLYMVVYNFVSGIRLVPRVIRPKKIRRGPVADLALTLEKSRQGTYFKWVIAHRLGRLTRALLAQREAHRDTKKFGPLQGRDWTPPQAVADYLEAGLNGSFADYPRARLPVGSRPPTPLDLPPDEVVRYLESQMETHRDRNP